MRSSATGQVPELSATSMTGKDETFERGYVEESGKLLHDLFSPHSSFKPAVFMEKLESQMKTSKSSWGPTILRQLFDFLLKAAPNRKLSAQHRLAGGI